MNFPSTNFLIDISNFSSHHPNRNFFLWNIFQSSPRLTVQAWISNYELILAFEP